MPTAAKAGMLPVYSDPCMSIPSAAAAGVRKKSRLGFERKNAHQDSAPSNSLQALWLEAVVRENYTASYYRARYYDPQSGKFISEDPIRFSAGVNFYAYVTNSPFNFTDPTGTQGYPSSNDNSEALNDYKHVGNIFDLIRANAYAKEALGAAAEFARQHSLPGGSLHNGAADAFRHCFWSCTMTRYLGEDVAETIADEHEKSGNRHGQPIGEELMDRANNLAGRTAALSCPKNGKNCWDLCTDLYNQHRLYGLGARPNYFPQQ